MALEDFQNKDCFIGFHSVNHLLTDSPKQIKMLLLQQDSQDKRRQMIINQASKHHIKIKYVAKKDLDQQFFEQTHQGIVALAERITPKKEADLEQYLDGDTFLLVLDGIQDPHNLGACLRSAETAGIDAIITPKHHSASVSTTVCKIACGAATLVPVIQVTNLKQTLINLKKQGIWIYGACGEAQTSIYHTNLKGPIAIVLGNESKGIRPLVKKQCDQLMNIPMQGHLNSLNVSVACGICLFEALRQRLLN